MAFTDIQIPIIDLLSQINSLIDGFFRSWGQLRYLRPQSILTPTRNDEQHGGIYIYENAPLGR